MGDPINPWLHQKPTAGLRCPKCGGWTFGTTQHKVGDGYETLTYNCTSDIHGTPLSRTWEEIEASVFNRGPRCGWRGKEFPEAGA